MISDYLQKKIERSIKLIQAAGKKAQKAGQPLEVCYSGGKDSDVILELTRMASVEYRAIYKNTTIDPPGTIKHAKENGADILQPQHSFFELMTMNGAPNRFSRHCCRYLKEYKVLDTSIMAVRRAESTKRAAKYQEPTECRIYGSKNNCVDTCYPILEWSNKDVVDFIVERQIKIHPLYYRADGSIDPKRRLGCMCCPLASIKNRISQFTQYPGMVKAYIRAWQKFKDLHPDSKAAQIYSNAYEWFVRDVFYDKQWQWEQSRSNMFGNPDYKQFLENYFKIEL